MPLAATVYLLERLRCGACGQVFTAQEPEGVAPEKYDETAVNRNLPRTDKRPSTIASMSVAR